MEDDTENYIYDYLNDSDFPSLNESDCAANSGLRGASVFLPLVYYLIFFTGFWGNLFVISVVGSKEKRGGRLVDIFVVNLALADLVFVLTLPLWAISASRGNHWNFGRASNLLCKLSSYVISVNRFSNISFLTGMSVDRYLAVVRPMDSRRLRSSRCARATCAALWLTSLLLGAPYLVYRGVRPRAPGEQACLEEPSSFFLGLNLLAALLTFVFPAFTIALCYGTVLAHLARHGAAAASPRAEARRRHSLKMVLCIIVAFVVSWLPYKVFKSASVIAQLAGASLGCAAQLRLQDGLVVSCCLAFFNSCVNPAIYFFLDQHFRRRAGSLYQRCTRKPQLFHAFNSSATFTNAGTSETLGTNGGRSQLRVSQQVEATGN